MSTSSSPKNLLTFWRMLLFATAAAVLVANLYYIQPLLATLAGDLHRPVTSIGYVITFTQLGYALGILFVVPLGDVLDRRNLLTWMLIINVLALLSAAASPGYATFGAASLAVGFSSCGIMIIVPYVASHARDDNRGSLVGTIMTGVLLGILLARTISGFMSQLVGWRYMYMAAAGLVTLLTIALRLAMPPEKHRGRLEYGKLLFSTVSLFGESPVLRLRAFFGLLGSASFNILWTGLTFLLSGPGYHYSAAQIGLFGLIGAAGTLSANLAGRFSDRGYASLFTYIGGVTLLFSWLIMDVGVHHLLLIIAGILFLDIAVQGLQVTNQSIIYRLAPDAQARITTVYVGAIFVGASLGSALASFGYSFAGWGGLCLFGGIMPVVLVATWSWMNRGVIFRHIGREFRSFTASHSIRQNSSSAALATASSRCSVRRVGSGVSGRERGGSERMLGP